MSFTAKLLKSPRGPIYLVTGKDHTGHAMWTYLAVDDVKHNVFKKALATGALRLTDFGRILASGYGQSPDAEVTARLKEEYGF